MLRVCLVCGGQSPEHEVSLRSAFSVFRAFPRDEYALEVVGITRDGVWKYYGDRDFLRNGEDSRLVTLADDGLNCLLCRNDGQTGLRIFADGRFIPCDIAFAMLHGANGEDGTIQGLFQLNGLPCVGCDTAASAVCMDKELTKIVLEHHGIRTAPWLTLRSPDELREADVIAKLGLPLFVKPARTGSSVGISKAKSAVDLRRAVAEAFEYDDKVLIEKNMSGREIECAVLDDGDALFCASPGEIIPHDEFYSYAAKYLLDDGASLEVPAKLDDDVRAVGQELAKRAFRALGCQVFSRIDFFLLPDGTWILNEVNTIPGFTRISLYPQLMACSGIGYQELLRRMLKGTFSHFSRHAALRTDAADFLSLKPDTQESPA